MFARLALAVAAASVVQAEYITVTVGGKDGMFVPRNVQAKVGDIVSFLFTPNALGNTGNHSVVQTSAEKPCTPLEGGFASPIAYWNYANFDLVITDATYPIWYACGSTDNLNGDDHCQAGEVGAINAPTEGFPTMTSFVTAAIAAPHDGAFDGVPRNGTGIGSGVSAEVFYWSDHPLDPYTGPVPDSSSDGAEPSDSEDSGATVATESTSGKKMLSAGAIAGIAVGSVVALLVAAFGVWRLMVRKTRKDETGKWAKSIDAVLARNDVKGAQTVDVEKVQVQEMRQKETV